jgi:hypothetical protein
MRRGVTPATVPLSGFPNLSAVSQQASRFVALFHATTVPGILPSEFSPRRDHVPLSRPLAPLQLSTRVQERTARGLITASFPDAHAFTQLPGSSDDYGVPFRKQECSLPGSLGSRTVKPPHSASFTYFEALLPLRIRSH